MCLVKSLFFTFLRQNKQMVFDFNFSFYHPYLTTQNTLHKTCMLLTPYKIFILQQSTAREHEKDNDYTSDGAWWPNDHLGVEKKQTDLAFSLLYPYPFVLYMGREKTRSCDLAFFPTPKCCMSVSGVCREGCYGCETLTHTFTIYTNFVPNFEQSHLVYPKKKFEPILAQIWNILKKSTHIYKILHYIKGHSDTKKLILLPKFAAHPRKVFCTEYPQGNM